MNATEPHLLAKQKYHVYFSGRESGSQGVHYPCSVAILANSPEEVWEKLHEKYEVGPVDSRSLWYFFSVGEPLGTAEVIKRITHNSWLK
jgi:hypothetical protein